jgi:Nuclease-related domain
VHSLTWLWGSWGEQLTADDLAKLGKGWYVRHDIENPFGNWDHVVIGPPGVFMIDTKRLTGKIHVTGDGLSSGRIRYAGSSFRGASVGLRRALLERGVRCPWVQAVVAIQGAFAEGVCIEGQVSYVAAGRLVDWLLDQPDRLSESWTSELVRALDQLRTSEARADLTKLGIVHGGTPQA